MSYGSHLHFYFRPPCVDPLRVVRQVVTQLQRVQTAGQSDESFKRATDDLLTSLTDHVMSLRERMMNIAVTPHQQSKFKQSQQVISVR